jgi:hypothetical protein
MAALQMAALQMALCALGMKRTGGGISRGQFT